MQWGHNTNKNTQKPGLEKPFVVPFIIYLDLRGEQFMGGEGEAPVMALHREDSLQDSFLRWAPKVGAGRHRGLLHVSHQSYHP